MHKFINRNIQDKLLKNLKYYPVVAILGSRQCGKSRLIKELTSQIPGLLYVDLQDIAGLSKLDNPDLFFKSNKERTICIDEIQKKPELFSYMRSFIDSDRRNGAFIILGSASRDLIKQSSESLAGRISYIELTPFLYSEISKGSYQSLTKLWTRGGYPESFLCDDEEISFEWRRDFIRTFLERDIPQLGFSIPVSIIGRLWAMCAHLNGQTLNSSSLGNSLGLSNHTINKYLNILTETFMLRLLPPYSANSGKRIVKSPKIYIRDTGILNTLLGIKDFNGLLSHPDMGASWEGLVIENILAELSDWKGYFYRTSSGSEIDLVLEKGLKKITVECKASTGPKVNKGFYTAMDDLKIERGYVIAPVEENYPVNEKVTVSSLNSFISMMKKDI
jgi:uncharacterized protein